MTDSRGTYDQLAAELDACDRFAGVRIPSPTESRGPTKASSAGPIIISRQDSNIRDVATGTRCNNDRECK